MTGAAVPLETLDAITSLSTADLEQEEERLLDRLRNIRALLAVRRRASREQAAEAKLALHEPEASGSS